MTATIELARRGAVTVLTISNEAKRNAFTHEMTKQLGTLLRSADEDPGVKAIIITGRGDVAFSSGHDLREMLADPEHASDPALNEPFLLPAQITTPTIAAINGYAFAAGFILALNCDLRICAENASFAAPGARIGLLPIGGQLSRLPLLLPRAIAHELLITCREMKAEEAHRLGFANQVVPRGEAVQAALATAEMIAANSASVIREIKRGLEVVAADGPAKASDFEWEYGRKLQDEPDAHEGITAFLEKRRPVFR
ncbi:enoyl-CoA hydratase/isomerase family protein [Rhodoligotrophos ferricapiens]|uniref:enoyl-CoA hydratase/isomerase family protein n=1 Tax=Rhodoligotrophos ferricapiens TaxID=3069264 RepID=UPI00315D1295